LSNTGNAAAPEGAAALCASLGEPSAVLRAMLDALPLGALVFDSGQRLVLANTHAEEWSRGAGLSGYSLDRLAEILILIDPRSERPMPAERTPLARALRGVSSEGEPYLLRRARGAASLWIECGARPLIGSDKQTVGAIFFFRDITDQRKQDFAAEPANQLRDFIYRENLAGIIHCSVDGRFLDCNDAILRMWGYSSREELFAVRAQQIHYDPADRDRMLRLLATTRRLNEYEACFRRLDGTRCWALLNVRLLDAPRGEVGGSIVATVIDITERKIWEETLRLSEQRFSAFMRHLPGVAFIKDLTGRYVYYNEAAWTLFSKKPDEIVGRTDDEIWPSENAARYRENDASVISSQKPFEFVEPVTHADGQHSWLIYKFPIIENGHVVLVGGVGIDITERTILEDQLTQARKMDALGRLAGGVAHDFNNLLTVISGYGQMAIEGVGEISDDRMVTYLQEMLNSSRRAAALTEQLLAFSRRQAVQPKVLDLCDLLRNMQRLLRRVIGEHVVLSVHTGPKRCLIQADPHQMEQVVMNLAVNARDAMPLGGSLDIRCECLAEPLAPASEEPGPPLAIMLEVRDTGVGMDQQVRPRIFDPFFTSKDPGKGTGLGLSTVYGIVSQAKGRIQVDSAVGEGTVFRIFLPEAAGEVAIAPPSRSGTPHGVETVLLVEDEAGVRALAETILSRLGYRVLVADCGSKAVDIWTQSRGRIDILLTDVIMPNMSGGDLAHKLRETNPNLKVLFMSGYTDDMIASHGALAGETQLLQKPFTAEGLGRKLRDVLDA
jgi:two-component system cell cycle sensor histidine kinase/response regulator CckA